MSQDVGEFDAIPRLRGLDGEDENASVEKQLAP